MGWLLYAGLLALMMLQVYTGLTPDRRLLDMCELMRETYPNQGGDELDCDATDGL